MPEEELEVTEQEQPIEVNPDNTKSVVTLMIVLSIIVMVFTPLITFFVITTFDPHKKAKVLDKTDPDLTEIKLDPPFSVNIKEASGTRYVRLDIVVEVSNSEMKKFFEEQGEGNSDGMKNKMRAEIVNIISDKTLSMLQTSKAKKDLADEIKTKLNDMLENKAKGVVKEVYFPSILIQ